MRELKFRGYAIHEDKWMYGNLVIGLSSTYILDVAWNDDYYSTFTNTDNTHLFHVIKPETTGQYTGLKDRYKKEIFEGDIVYYCGEIHKIEFQNCAWTFAVIKPKDFVVEGLYETHKNMTINSFLCEVIGNIHQNPELL